MSNLVLLKENWLEATGTGGPFYSSVEGIGAARVWATVSVVCSATSGSLNIRLAGSIDEAEWATVVSGDFTSIPVRSGSSAMGPYRFLRIETDGHAFGNAFTVSVLAVDAAT